MLVRIICSTMLPMLLSAGAQRPTTDSIDAYVRRAMVRQHIPGLTLVVIRNGKVIKSRGYGYANLESKSPARPETAYELASASKPLVAEAIMLLVQDGKVALDDTIGRYIEGTPDSWRAITLRHLLSHTSGIKDYLADLRRNFSYDTPPDRFAKEMMNEPLKFQPGEKWSYSNSGYILLGMVIQQATGRPYHAFLADRIFTPLGMSATRHDTPDEVIDGRAVGYLWRGTAGYRNGEYLKYLMMNHGDRGIVSTATDLAKWDAALSRDGMLTAATRQTMWTPIRLSNGSSYGYGLGWFIEEVNGHSHIFHPGGAPGTATMISRYPDDGLTVILLTNGGAAYVQALDFGIAQRYIPTLAPRVIANVRRATLDAYTGYYNVFGSQLLRVVRDGNTLALDDGGGLANAFLPLSSTAFVADDADRGFTIHRGEEGVIGMTLRLLADTFMVQRIGPLPASVKIERDANPVLTQETLAVLTAFAAGRSAVEDVKGVAPQARRDFARGSSPEFAGVQGLVYITSRDVTGRGITRHGAPVAQVGYYRMRANGVNHDIVVYFTADNLVTDVDVL